MFSFTGPVKSLPAVPLLMALTLFTRGEILKFGEGALPNCAYDCKGLYAAQYDCGNDMGCFCGGATAAVCAGVCGPEQMPLVQAWLTGACGGTAPGTITSRMESGVADEPTTGAPTTSETPSLSSSTTIVVTTITPIITSAHAPPTPTRDTAPEGRNHNEPEPENEKKGFAKYWPLLLTGLLLLLAAILLAAFYIPYRRYMRREITRSKSPLPYLEPTLPDMLEYDSETRMIPSSPRFAAADSDGMIGIALSPGLSPAGSGVSPRSGASPGSGVSPGTASLLVPSPAVSPGAPPALSLGLGGGMAVLGAVGGAPAGYEGVRNSSENPVSEAVPRPGMLRPVLSVRQESWERRLREHHMGQKRTGWKRWMKGREEEDDIPETTVLGHRSSSVV